MSYFSQNEFISEYTTESSSSVFVSKHEYESHIAYLAKINDDNTYNDDTYAKILKEHINALKEKMNPNNIERTTEESYREEDDLEIEEEKTKSELEENIDEINKPFRNLIQSLRYIPRLEDISETSFSEETSTIETERALSDPDIGVFSEEIPERRYYHEGGEKDKVKEVIEEEQDEVEEEEVLELEEDEEEEEEEEWPFLESSSSTVHLESMDKVDELFDMFLNTISQKSVECLQSNLVDMQFSERTELKKYLDQILTEVLDFVIDFCKERAALYRMKNKLDKVKLHKACQDQFINLIIECSLNRQINRKVVDFYRRKKNISCITLPARENMEESSKRLMNAYHKLNILMGREKHGQTTFENESEKLNNTMASLRGKVDIEINVFNELVHNTLTREQFKHLPTSIQVKLKKMAEFRKEISTVRVDLLLRQHTVSVLLKRSDKKELIGNNLKLKDYMDLETEVKNLDDKLSERSEDVSKLQYRFCNETNIFSHLKCCKNLIQMKLDLKVKYLFQCYRDFRNMRSKLSTLEKRRAEIRQQRQEMSFQCGLLEKTPLMYDYDLLILGIEAKQKSINDLKIKHIKILQSVKNLETKACGT